MGIATRLRVLVSCGVLAFLVATAFAAQQAPQLPSEEDQPSGPGSVRTINTTEAAATERR